MTYMDHVLEKLINHYGGTKEDWLELVKSNGFAACLECFDLIVEEQNL